MGFVPHKENGRDLSKVLSLGSLGGNGLLLGKLLVLGLDTQHTTTPLLANLSVLTKQLDPLVLGVN